MKQTYRFFNNFIITELDLDIPEQKAAYDMLNAMDAMYKIAGHVEGKQKFIKLRELIEKSRELHKEVNLFVVPKHTLATGANWRPVDKSIRVEVPDLYEYSKFVFATGLIFELCNSANISLNNMLLIGNMASENISLDAFLTELAEYNTVGLDENIRLSLLEDANKFLNNNDELIKLLTLLCDNDFECKLLIINNMKIFCKHTQLDRETSFVEHFWYVNSHESSGNRGYSHFENYVQRDLQIKLELKKTEQTEDDKLDKIFEEISKQIKENSFNHELMKQKHSRVLHEVASQFPLKKSEYYLLYEIITNDGKRLEDYGIQIGSKYKQVIDCLMELNFVFIEIARGKVNLKNLPENDRDFIFLVFDILDHSYKSNEDDIKDMWDKLKDIVELFMPRLFKIQKLDNHMLAEKHNNIVEFFIKFTSAGYKKEIMTELEKFVQNANEQSKQQLTPEVMELIQSADGYRSMWRHQTEHYLFKYNMLTQQAAVTFAFGDRKTQFKPVCEVLDGDDSKYKYDDSIKRICYR